MVKKALSGGKRRENGNLSGMRMRRIDPIVIVVLLTNVICAYFLSRGATQLVAASAFEAAPTGTTAKPIDAGLDALPPPGSTPPDSRAILKRNIFDSKTGPLWPPPKEPESESKPEEKAEIPEPGPHDPPPICKEKIYLILMK
jgi:hypothetical protein